MRVAIIDENASRAALIREALSAVDDCTLTIITEMRELVTRIPATTPDIVLIDFANPARDMLEEHFAGNRALARPISLFVDETTSAAIDAGLSIYAVAGQPCEKVRALRDLALQRFTAFAGEAG
jgi:response regulator NasT